MVLGLDSGKTRKLNLIFLLVFVLFGETCNRGNIYFKYISRFWSQLPGVTGARCIQTNSIPISKPTNCKIKLWLLLRLRVLAGNFFI
jgi:hypothetical protein